MIRPTRATAIIRQKRRIDQVTLRISCGRQFGATVRVAPGRDSIATSCTTAVALGLRSHASPWWLCGCVMPRGTWGGRRGRHWSGKSRPRGPSLGWSSLECSSRSRTQETIRIVYGGERAAIVGRNRCWRMRCGGGLRDEMDMRNRRDRLRGRG